MDNRITKFVAELTKQLNISKETGEKAKVAAAATILSYFKDDYFSDVIHVPEDLLYLIQVQHNLEENTSMVYLEEAMMEEFAESQEKALEFHNIVELLAAQ